MEYVTAALVILLIAVIIIYYRKDAVKIIRKVGWIKKCAESGEAEYIADTTNDLDLLAQKIAAAWWKEYTKRFWIKIILAALVSVIGLNAVDSYLETLASQFKGFFDVFAK